MKHSDIEIILKIWDRDFDPNNEQDRAQALVTYGKLIALKHKLMTEDHTNEEETKS